MAKKTIKSKAWNTCYFGMKKLVKLKKKNYNYSTGIFCISNKQIQLAIV